MAASGSVRVAAALAFADHRPEDVWRLVHDRQSVEGGWLRRTAQVELMLSDELVRIGRRDGELLLVVHERSADAPIEYLGATDDTGRPLHVLTYEEARETFLRVLVRRLRSVLGAAPTELDGLTTVRLSAVFESIVGDVLRLPPADARAIADGLFVSGRDEALAVFGRILDTARADEKFRASLPESVDGRALLQHALLVLRADADFHAFVVRLATTRIDLVAVPFAPQPPLTITVTSVSRHIGLEAAPPEPEHAEDIAVQWLRVPTPRPSVSSLTTDARERLQHVALAQRDRAANAVLNGLASLLAHWPMGADGGRSARRGSARPRPTASLPDPSAPGDGQRRSGPGDVAGPGAARVRAQAQHPGRMPADGR